MTRPPESLPEKAFLLAYDLRRQRLTGRGELGYLLRAAALADLLLRGHLADESGKARTVKPAADLDPVLRAAWEEIEYSSPRSWRRWVSVRRRGAVREVRDQLADAGVVKLDQRRILGLFPATRITVRQHAEVKRLAEQVGRAIRGGQPASRVEPDTAALAALAAAGRLRLVLTGADQRRHRGRLSTLADPIQPIAAALRRAIAAKRAAAASSG